MHNFMRLLLCVFLISGCQEGDTIHIPTPYGKIEYTPPPPEEEEDCEEYEDYDDWLDCVEDREGRSTEEWTNEDEEAPDIPPVRREIEREEIVVSQPAPHALCPALAGIPTNSGLDRRLITMLCGFLNGTTEPYKQHSGIRNSTLNAHSQHNHGCAMDFHMGDYTGLDEKERLELWTAFTLELSTYLLSHSLAHTVGLGYYCQANNPFVHLDACRSKSVAWSQIDDKEAAPEACAEWVDDKLRGGGIPFIPFI